ncbi:MAG: diguanylate cyclase domain-containing protein [Candidatus Pristimantibacillus sp.]
MKAHFRLKLTITMIVFALAISITLATTDYFRLKNLAINNAHNQLQQDVEMLTYALETSEKASFMLGENIAEIMRDSSLRLLNKYDRTPSFDEWDFELLRQMFSLDIYIINSQNMITHSTMPSDIGLNFSTCCSKLAAILDERRASGDFHHDGFDVEQHTGKIKKYSYMATPDKKYMIQLGYSLEEGAIFQQFNFFNTIDRLIHNNGSINEINVLNIGGLPLGEIKDKLNKDRRAAFEHTLATGETTELKSTWNDTPAIYLYVQYSSNFDTGTTRNKVLEVIYNEHDLQAILSDNQQTFIIQLIMVTIVAIVLALIISRWVARPMHLAFHDSLTGLKNRAAFDETLETILAANKGMTALLMIDLDNFKQVNDSLGHDKGDQLLQGVADIMRSVAGKSDIVFRLGGDEFVIVMPLTNKQAVARTAHLIITAVESAVAQEAELTKDISVSIGISFAPEHGIDQDSLCKKADMALYLSKESGKNQYQFYAERAG